MLFLGNNYHGNLIQERKDNVEMFSSGFVNTIDQLSAFSMMMRNKDTSSTDRQDKAPPTESVGGQTSRFP